jgi:P-type conjugative transfer protein TrbJ
MNRSKIRILVVAVASLMLLPAAAHADIVFDPTNFVEAVLQVESDIQMVDNLYQEVTNDVAMVKGWNFTQLPGLLQNMNVWQQVFGQAGSTYSSTDPANALSTMFPSDLGTFANTADGQIAAMRSGWDQEERSVLVENRTVQNQTYLNLQPTAQRIQQYVEHSNSASGATSAMQAGNEETATLIAQLQTLQSQEITDGRAEVEKAAQAQAEQAYAQAQQQAVRGNWSSPQQPSTSLVDAFPLANQ